jgi:Arc/MetJ-type ribon-helix-helix transcriptional regulator
MKLITLYLPETYIKALDQLVDERFYPNRAEAIRPNQCRSLEAKRR